MHSNNKIHNNEIHKFFSPVKTTQEDMEKPITLFFIHKKIDQPLHPATLPINSLVLFPKYAKMDVVDASLYTIEINPATHKPAFLKLPFKDEEGMQFYDYVNDLKKQEEEKQQKQKQNANIQNSSPDSPLSIATTNSPATVASPTNITSAAWPRIKLDNPELRVLNQKLLNPEKINPNLFIMKRIHSAEFESDFTFDLAFR